MSDKASIFLRFNLLDEKTGERIKGIMGNHYQGYDPVGLMTRSMYGALSFLEGRKYTRFLSLHNDREESQIYQLYRRMFDTDFIHRTMDVSEDSAKWIKERYRAGEVKEEDAGTEFFWCDTDFGQVVLDVTGTLYGDVTLKYAIVDNLHLLISHDDELPVKIMTINDYMDEYDGCFEEYYDEENECFELMKAFLEKAELMTHEELSEYFETPLKEYMQLEEKVEEEFDENAEMDFSDIEGPYNISIDNLGLSVRSYVCLKRAGIENLEQVIGMYQNHELENVRNLGKKGYEEIEGIIQKYWEEN